MRQLCHSYIVPEWAYRLVYDAMSTALLITSLGHRCRKVQVGFCVHLFCFECEGRIERIEIRFRRYWGANDRFPSVLTKSFVALASIDFKNTTLFLLSII